MNQWSADDNFLRTDFNEDNAKIEAALSSLAAGQVSFTAGTYRGNGSESQEITLDFRPSAVMLSTIAGMTHNSNLTYGGVFSSGNPLWNAYGTYVAAEIIDNGFKVYFNTNNQCGTNAKDFLYNYIAVKW